MALNFGSLATTQVSTNNYLRPWGIYEGVKFDGIEGPTTGTSSAGNDWARYDILFSSPEGTYKHSLFEPKDDKQRSYPNSNGHDMYYPSALEEAMNLLALIGTTFNPEGFEKVQANVSKCKSFDQVIKLFMKFVGTPEKTTSMKLVGRNNEGSVYATLPRWTGVSKKLVTEGQPWDAEANHYQVFIPNNAVFGDKLGWSSWEKDKVDEYKKAKPSDAPKDPSTSTTGLEEEDNSELDDLLGL